MSVTKERPAIFTADEVRAILDGRKTMKRWVIKGDPEKIDVRGKWIIHFDGLNCTDTLLVKRLREFCNRLAVER